MLITEIAAAPSLPSSFVSLHLSPCMLISKISLLHLSSFICLPACWFAKSPPLHLFPFLCLPACLFPKAPPLQLSPFICLPACWFPKSPFFICLPSFVSLHADSQSPCMLITEIAAAPIVSLLHLSPFICLPACWLPKSLPLLVSLLHLSPFICLPACWFPKFPFFMCLPSFVSLHADSQNHRLFSCLPSFVSLHADSQSLPSSFVSLHLSPCMLIPNLPACWLPKLLPLLVFLLHLSPFIPQIAGSYRGSYFSMTVLLIPKIAKWSWCRCRLVSLCVPSFVPLHDLHSGLPLAAAAALSSKLVSLHDLHSGCSWLPLPPCPPSFVFQPCLCSLLPLPPRLPSLFFGNAIWGLCRYNYVFLVFFIFLFSYFNDKKWQKNDESQTKWQKMTIAKWQIKYFNVSSLWLAKYLLTLSLPFCIGMSNLFWCRTFSLVHPKSSEFSSGQGGSLCLRPCKKHAPCCKFWTRVDVGQSHCMAWAHTRPSWKLCWVMLDMLVFLPRHCSPNSGQLHGALLALSWANQSWKRWASKGHVAAMLGSCSRHFF